MPGKHERDDSTYLQQLDKQLFDTDYDHSVPDHDRIEEGVDEQQVEILSLRLDVEEIKERVHQLGTYQAASFRHFPLSERRLSVYLDQSLPAGVETSDHFQYLRLLVNRMTSLGEGSELADIEDYYVDLDNGGIMSYRGQARKTTSGWRLPNGTPPIVVRFGMGVNFLESSGYSPDHPRIPDETTLLEGLRYQRQEAQLVLSVLKHLNPQIRADITIPYGEK